MNSKINRKSWKRKLSSLKNELGTGNVLEKKAKLSKNFCKNRLTKSSPSVISMEIRRSD